MAYVGNETKVSPNFLKLIQLYMKGLVKSRGVFLSTRKIYTFYDKKILSIESLYIDNDSNKLKKQRIKNFTYLELLKELNTEQDYNIIISEHCNDIENGILVINREKLYHLRNTLANLLNLELTQQDKLVNCVLISSIKKQGITYMISDFLITEGV